MAMNEYVSLFETREAKSGIKVKVVALSILVGICLVCVYRIIHIPAQGEEGRWAWIGLCLAEAWFILYWFITQFNRWHPVDRYTFKHRLAQRYEEDLLGVDVFVCTADPMIEPPIMVINTILSVMAYDYPLEKLSVYLSDDGGSELTFYAMLEASRFAKLWLPFCRKYTVEPRSPAVYFGQVTLPPPELDDHVKAEEWVSIKKLYEDMKERIETTTRLGHISEQTWKQHKGFREWDLGSNSRNHKTILQIIIDGRDPEAVDIEGQPLPTLVYLSREKRPNFHHNFKAGAMNALLRVSSKISNGGVILNVDCDMYSNNSESVRDAMCFFMDEEKSHDIAYVQYQQWFDNITKNDIYGHSFRVINEVELEGMDYNGGLCYIGTGCFHRRDTLCGKKYSKECKGEWRKNNGKIKESASILEETCKVLASCTYEHNTQWGKEMGLKYGCAVEDIITGLAIQCRGWRSVYFNPKRKGFIGIAPNTLLQTLVQHKRWAEGHLQIVFSKYFSLLYGYGKIPLKLQFSYCTYNFWSLNCFATLYYVSIPPLCLLRGTSLFPKVSSLWFIPFAWVIMAKYGYSLYEFLYCGGTLQGWWNEQRMWMFRRTTSYLFAFLDTILKLLGFSNTSFIVTAKVSEDDVSQRYEQEMIEFGCHSPMFTILATLALLNLFSFVGVTRRLIVDSHTTVLNTFALQFLLCGVVIFVNLPVYQGLFFRKDKGRMPTSVTYQSSILAILACSLALY